MIALIRSGRDRRVEEPPPVPVVDDASVEAPPPPTVVIEHRGVIEHREPQVQQVVVPVPVYVPVYPTRGRLHRSEPFTGIQESTSCPCSRRGRQAAKGTEPVYWGFGGKLRPDAWGQPQDRDKKPSEDGDKDKDKGERSRSLKK